MFYNKNPYSVIYKTATKINKNLDIKYKRSLFILNSIPKMKEI